MFFVLRMVRCNVVHVVCSGFGAGFAYRQKLKKKEANSQKKERKQLSMNF